MLLSIRNQPGHQGIKKLLLEFEENAEGTDNTNRLLPKGHLTEFLDRTGEKPNEYVDCEISFVSASVFTRHIHYLDTLVAHVPTRLPNLGHMMLYLPHQIQVTGLRHVTQWLKTSAFSFLDHDRYDEGILLYVNQRSVFITAYGEAEGTRSQHFLFHNHGPPPIGTRGTEDLYKLVFFDAFRSYRQKITSVVLSETTHSVDYFQTVCSLARLERLEFRNITLSSSEVATLTRALTKKVTSTNGKKESNEQQETGSLGNVYRLAFENVILETYNDFVLMCGAVGGNDTIHQVFVDGLTILNSRESTFGPIANMLCQNHRIYWLQCTGNSRFVPAEKFAITQAQQQNWIYWLLKFHSIQLERFLFGEWTHFPKWIQDRLDLHFYTLPFILDRFDLCTLDPRNLGVLLAKAIDIETKSEEKPCLLSCFYILFQAEPNLVHLIPPQALD